MITGLIKNEKKMEEGRFYISQSALKDWDQMCPIAFNAKWSFEGDELDNPWSIGYKDSVRWGVHFETLVVGSGMGQKTIEYTVQEKRSVNYERIRRQAKVAREYLKFIGVKILAVQDYVQTSFEWEGSTIYIQGNIDIRGELKDGTPIIIDLKSTADLESNFGPFQWKTLERIDTTQLEHYKLLHLCKFGTDCETQYHVFDLDKQERFSPIQVNISEWTIEKHKARVAKAYKEITQAMMIDYWEPRPSFTECKACPLRDTCKFAAKFPEIQFIDK